MRVRLEYGRTGLEVELPDERVVRTLAYKDAPPLGRPRAALREALEHPTGTPPLAELARGRKRRLHRSSATSPGRCRTS